ncbi:MULTISPECIES: hypothetical protein [Yersinia]|uniref:Uncharacterized protein n=1 Tax=Yersinia massiliensis TaxID=419257 RepID=A0ABM6UT03_9GAMM|nr:MULTISPECIES: hypothetical protein [Yersinia]EKN4854359.1 hypothetical protein [Yersinia enterocolitica]AVX37837.1 hypothetical protein DA391_09270 [Yersinia massiliensis]EKN6263117.1 hypothetical protein [Yersinia enterocolitica]ELW8194982.1 hypothetical protein [Yersinia enterocolitica]HDX8417784.1 hypothetical protein [Yersinia enterocolitica]
MRYQIEEIAAFDYPDDNESGIVGTVNFIYEDHNRNIKVFVCIPHDKNSSLAVIEQRIFEQAKKQLKELASEI